MSGKSVAVKLTLSAAEIESIDELIKKGLGKNRADVCRIIITLYRAGTEA